MTAALVFAIGVAWTRATVPRVAAAAFLLLLVGWVPILVVPLGLITGGYLIRRRLQRRISTKRAQSTETARLAELTVIGLTGGLGLQPALGIAASTLGGGVGEETRAMLRRMRIDGAAACIGIGGVAAEMYRTIARATAGGAPVADQVRRIADQLHADIAASQLQALRRLPVLMLFPLTLLILPGFLLLTVAPALAEAFSRIEF